MKLSIIAPLLLASLTLAKPIAVEHPAPAVRSAASGLPRLVIYHQTIVRDGIPVSVLPLVTNQGVALTNLIVAAVHVKSDYTIHLNDNPPDDVMFTTLWSEVKVLQDAGVTVSAMVGGGAAGSYSAATLGAADATTFEKAYQPLAAFLKQYGMQGVDLDVEEAMSAAAIERLITRLRADFGADFIITMAPVAAALIGGGNLSGFDYVTLEKSYGTDIGFYNVQFYNGWGGINSGVFEVMVDGGFSASEIVIGQLTSPKNGGSGYIPPEQLNATIVELRQQHGEIGGVMGWEYFNSLPGDTAEPLQWAVTMTEILRPNATVSVNITASVAQSLSEAWAKSITLSGDKAATAALASADPAKYVDLGGAFAPDYFAMINA